MTGIKTNLHLEPSSPADMDCCLLRVRGLVQGVGFRHALNVEASRAGLAGWVRNRHDGSVEALLHGPRHAVAVVVDWAHRGPPAARVDSVETTPAVVDVPPVAFEQRPTA